MKASQLVALIVSYLIRQGGKGQREIKMKRPKPRDMTDLEKARIRLRQARLGAQRRLQDLDGQELPPDERFSKEVLRCIIMATEPAEIANADLAAAISMMKYVATVAGEIDRALY